MNLTGVVTKDKLSEIINRSTGKYNIPHWVLVTKDIVPKYRIKKDFPRCILKEVIEKEIDDAALDLNSENKVNGLEYQLPNLIDLIICNIANEKMTGDFLLKSKNKTFIHTFCEETIENTHLDIVPCPLKMETHELLSASHVRGIAAMCKLNF